MKHFTINELSRSETAEKMHIKNAPDSIAITNLTALVTNVLDPARDFLGIPIIVTSGYRSSKLNSAIGGVPTSQHCVGSAADITVHSLPDLPKLYAYIADNLVFDQLIYYKRRNFIHVSYVSHRQNREQTIIKI